jgi:cellulose synthase operon protein C
MTLPCFDLVRFADGELEPERAEIFRSHLLTCATCQAGLVEAMQLGARLSALTPIPEYVRLAPDPPPEVSSKPPVESPPFCDPATKPKHRIAFFLRGATLSAVALVACVVFVVWTHRPAQSAAHPDGLAESIAHLVEVARVAHQTTNPFVELKTRPFDARVAYADAASYRRPRDTMRGAGGLSEEGISYAALDVLQRSGDDHGLAIARAWNGEDLNKVAEPLRKLAALRTASSSVRNDHAVIEMLRTASTDNIEPVLAEFDLLRRGSDAASHSARWNYALLLAHMELPLSAAQAFRAIAEEGEPGWADEARQRAEPEERRGQDARTSWMHANEEGEGLLKTGTPVSTELVQRFPGLMRAYFYNAVRTAPSRERVLALVPMAAELDRSSDRPILVDYVRRVASLDFQRRAPLATAYAQLMHGAPLAAEVQAALTSETPSSDVVDIVMGAMVTSDVVTGHLEAFRRMAKQANDLWFEIVLARAEATVDVQRNNWLGAEARLRKAEKLCSPAITYQCLGLARQLGKLYEDLHRIPEAATVVRTALGTARSSREWGRYIELLWQLADIERFNSSTATARAYANEILLIADRCDYQSSAYRTLTGAALLEADGTTARRNLEAVLRCVKPDLPAANYLTDIGRLDPRPDDLAQLQGWLGTLRTNGTLTAADRVLADEIEGRLLIERDRAAGTTLLEKAIASSAALPADVNAAKTRAGAYSVLVIDAARHGDHTKALALIAQEIGLSQPGSCAVGMAAEGDRSIVIVRGVDGKDRAKYDPTRRLHNDAWTVSTELARTLDGCTHVQVMAQAALQGQPRVLPAAVPWSYATGAHGHSPVQRDAQNKGQAEAQTLIVTNVTPPAYLHLPPLSAPSQAPLSAPSQALTSSPTTLSGPDATPARVLSAMGDASEIQFHTHALLDVGISDASHLVLSPGLDGGYALTAEAIQHTELRGHPIIVLAACHSAQGARYQHEPWSLPEAFLAAGARGVFAAGADIPDREAGPFFAGVLARVRAGADPASALRDERMAVLASSPLSWVADVILFE